MVVSSSCDGVVLLLWCDPHTHISVCTYMHLHPHMFIFTHTYTNMYICVFLFTLFTYIYMYIYMLICMSTTTQPPRTRTHKDSHHMQHAHTNWLVKYCERADVTSQNQMFKKHEQFLKKVRCISYHGVYLSLWHVDHGVSITDHLSQHACHGIGRQWGRGGMGEGRHGGGGM